jgi:PAS domain S-box-containing protein
MSEKQQLILVVDDDPSGRYASSRILRRAGYEVIEADCGNEALRIAASDHPDLVLLDVMLPDISGLEVSGRIKSAPETASIAILQMSASAVDDHSRITALESGADAYITSPAEPGVLVATVRSLLRAHRAERALAESARDWEATFDSIGDGVALLDSEGIVRRCNTSLARMLGMARDAIPGRHIEAFIPPPAGSARAQSLGESRRSLECVRDGRILYITVDPVIESGAVCGGVAIVADITERRRLEQRLQQSQKLESIGMLAGGVAHDFNNLLMGILGNTSLALDSQPLSAKTRRALEDVVRASERAADLTRQLLAYAGKGRFVVDQVDVSRLVHEIAPLIQSSIPRKVQLMLNVAVGLPAIEADRVQIEQVIMNLIINAAEAMDGEAGTVTVTTGARTVSPAEAGEFICDEPVAGSFVFLRVHDTGKGMDEETMSRIFDPFFSTKFLGRGLGLSATLGIIRGHKGAIRVTSALGKGTTFEVLLPAGATQRSAEGSGSEPIAANCGTILAVDDEETIRRLMKAALERYGYEVLLAENGSEAISIFANNADRISLVVLDLVMPVMSGEEVLAHLLTMRPEIPVLVSSGQDTWEGLRKLGPAGVAGYLQKPYRAEALVRRVGEILSGAAAASASGGRGPEAQNECG